MANADDFLDAPVPTNADSFLDEETPVVQETPKIPMDFKALNKEAAAKGQVYVQPAFGLSAAHTADLYAFAERASTAMRGIGQMLGIHEDGTEEEIRKREALEANPQYAKGAKIAGVAGLIADPLTYAVPLGKAATMGQFIRQSALMGGAIGFTGAKTEEESRGKKAIEGAALGGLGGAVLGQIARTGGKMFGKDWLPWKATPEEKAKVIEEIKKTSPEIPEEQINHFLNAPEDSHINAKNYAEHLISTGASPKKVEAAIKTNPLIGTYLDNYRNLYEHMNARFNATSRLAQEDTELLTKAEKQAKFEADQKAMQEAGAARTVGVDVAAQQKAEALAAQNKALQEAGAARTIPQITKGEQNAVQEQSAAGVLPRPQEGIGEAGSERGGIRQGIQGEETTQESIQKEEIKSFGNKEAGKIDPTLATQAASQISGVVLGAALNPQDPWTGAVAGGAAGYGGAKVVGKLFQEKSTELLAKTPVKDSAVGDFFTALGNGADKAAGWLSTRLENESPALALHALDNERKIQKQTFDAISGSDKFLTTIGSKLKPQTEEIKNLWLNGDRESIRKILVSHGDKDALASYEHLVSTHDSIGRELKARGLIKGVIEGHLPRIVKDREGLLNSIGLEKKTAVEELLRKESLKQGGIPLDDVAASNVINKYLRNSAPAGTGKPSFTKTRVFSEVTPEMQKFYYDVAESYHTYTSRAINEINTSDFFGKSGVIADGAINVDESIGNVLNKLVAEGRIKESQFDNVRNLLETRYKFGNQVANKYVQEYKNWTTGILLADISSSIQNVNDIALASFHYGLTPTMASLAKKLAGKQKLTVEDYGLVNHISEEFISSTSSKRYVDRAMKLSGWSIFDPLGKEVALNASLNRATNKSASEEGIKWLETRYGNAFGSDFPKLIQDLQKGEQTDLVKLMAFYDVTKHQPLTKLQRTELASKYPNAAGLVYQFKSFMLGQANLIRTEVYNEYKKGNIAEATKKTAMLGMGFAAVGASNMQIQNWLLNKDEKFEGVDIFWNATKQFGLSKYTYEQIKKGEGGKAIGSIASPPTALASGWTTTNPATGETEVDKFGVVRKIPIAGKELAGYAYQVSPEEKAMNKRIAAERTRIMKSELEQRAKEIRIDALQEKLKREQERRKTQQRGIL